jgi:hypothetical protein
MTAVRRIKLKTFISKYMKQLIILVIILAKTCLVFAQQKAIIQDCSPTYKENYDFQVGDFFKYTNHSIWTGDEQSDEITTTGYTITGRLEHGDTLKYTMHGKEIVVQYEPCFSSGCTFYPPVIISTGTITIDDTLTYIDSTNHFLNKCPGSLINVNNLISLADTNYYTKVQILQQNDSVIKKIVGGENNIYIYDSTGTNLDSTSLWNDPDSYKYNFKQVYAKGLGLYYEYQEFFEGRDEKTLVAYIKGTDTVGNITSIDVNEVKKSIITLYPNPVSDDLFIRLDNSVNLINIYNMTGQLIYSRSITNFETDLITINMTAFNQGLYLVVLTGRDKTVMKFEKL